MSARRSTVTGRVRVLFIGSVNELGGAYAYLSADPFFELHPVPAQIYQYKWDDLRRMTRLYMPHSYQALIAEYDLISLIGGNPLVFGEQNREWLRRAVVEGGLGNLVVGTGTWHFSDWIEYSRMGEVFPFEVPVPIEIRSWSELRILKPESPLMSSLPFSEIGSRGWLEGFTPVKAKAGAEVDAEIRTINGRTNPFVVWWDVGEGRSLGHSAISVSRWWDTFYDWKFMPDWIVNIHLFSAGMDLPPDPYIVHDIRLELTIYHATGRSLLSTMDFIAKFGAPTESIEGIIYGTNLELKEVDRMYLDLDLEGSLGLVRELVSRLNGGVELAMKLKNQALYWTHLIEWLAVMGVALSSGSALWAIMVRRRFYREIRPTRLSVSGSLE